MQTLINDLYGVLDSNGKVKDFAIDGSEMGVVTAQTNPLTGRNEISSGGIKLSMPWDIASKKLGHVGDRLYGAHVNTASFALSATTYTWHLFFVRFPLTQ